MADQERKAPRLWGRLLLIDGLALGGLFCAVMLGALWADPLIHLDNYPPDIRSAVGDSQTPPVMLQALTAAAFLLLLFGGLFMSLRRLDRVLDGIAFRQAALHTFLLFWIVNIVDLVVVDWLFFMNLWRRHVVLPGTEGLAGYGDYFFHFQASFLSATPWVGSVILSTMMAAGWWRLVIRRRGPGRRQGLAV